MVTLALPPQFTVEPLTKLLPFTVSVKAPLPAVAVEGLRLDMAGTGLFTVKLLPAEVPPSVFTTVTAKVPAVASCAEGMVTDREVLLTEAGVRLVPPFHFTSAPLIKPVPVTVMAVFPLPAVADDTLKLLIAGVLVVITKLLDAVVPPPGVALVTVTAVVPAVFTSAKVMAAVNWVADT